VLAIESRIYGHTSQWGSSTGHLVASGNNSEKMERTISSRSHHSPPTPHQTVQKALRMPLLSPLPDTTASPFSQLPLPFEGKKDGRAQAHLCWLLCSAVISWKPLFKWNYFHDWTNSAFFFFSSDFYLMATLKNMCHFFGPVAYLPFVWPEWKFF
jgi:hypothetical protein